MNSKKKGDWIWDLGVVQSFDVSTGDFIGFDSRVIYNISSEVSGQKFGLTLQDGVHPMDFRGSMTSRFTKRTRLAQL